MADSVLIDRELSPVARLVYCELTAWVRKGENTVSRGHRSMAERLGINRGTVARCLKRLEERGHLQRVEAGRGIRGCYVLLSPVYVDMTKARKKAARSGGRSGAKPRRRKLHLTE